MQVLDFVKRVSRWLSTGTPTQAGEIGMDVATGRPLAYIGGISRSLAHTGELGVGAALNAPWDGLYNDGTYDRLTMPPRYKIARMGADDDGFNRTNDMAGAIGGGSSRQLYHVAGTYEERFSSVAGSSSRILLNALAPRQLRRVVFRFITGADITVSDMGAGISSNIVETQTPANNSLVCSYSTTRDGTVFWRFWAVDFAGAGNGTPAKVTTVPVIASTPYELDYDFEDFNSATPTVTMRLRQLSADGRDTVANEDSLAITANLPASATQLLLGVGVTPQEAVEKQIGHGLIRAAFV